MSIQKFKQFEKYEHAYQSNDFTELEEIWSIICDLNLGNLSKISVYKSWCKNDLDMNAAYSSLYGHCITSSVDPKKLGKLYSIGVKLSKDIFKDIDLYSNFSEDFFTTCDRLKDLGEIRIQVYSEDRYGSDGLVYEILLKVKRK